MEIIRYQVLMPVNEVQVRSTTIKSADNENGNASGPASLYNWELIFLKKSQSGTTQRRTEKVYQLANKCVSARFFRCLFLLSRIRQKKRILEFAVR